MTKEGVKIKRNVNIIQYRRRENEEKEGKEEGGKRGGTKEK